MLAHPSQQRPLASMRGLTFVHLTRFLGGQEHSVGEGKIGQCSHPLGTQHSEFCANFDPFPVSSCAGEESRQGVGDSPRHADRHTSKAPVQTT